MSRMSTRRRNEQGFALLLVFAMAAAVMVMLYLEMPRVAFEYQRNKEGLLVERGEQYTRAIALYYRKFAKLPQNVDELETTNNLRFLRRRYEDPMTGKDEWRLVHVDAAGQYVDSLVHKKDGQGENKGPSVLAATIQGIGSQAEYTPGLGGEQEKNPALQRRASDRIIPGMPGGAAQQGESGDNNVAQEEGRSAPATPANPFEGVPAGSPQAPATGPGSMRPPGVTAPPGAGAASSQGGSGMPGAAMFPGQTVPGMGTGGTTGSPGPAQTQSGSGFGMGGGFGAPPPPSTGGTSAGQPGMPGQTGSPGPGGGFGSQPMTPQMSPNNPMMQGQRPGAVPDGTMRAISGMITGQQQRPGSMTGSGATATGGGQLPGAGGTGGLVGLASKAEMKGILVYNEKTNIKEWEFLFDMKKAAQAAAGQQGNPQGQNPLQPGNQNQRPNTGNPFQGQPGNRPMTRP